MSPKDDGEAEDFVIVDNPTYVLPLRGGRNGSNTFNPPVETDYVTVDNENPADQDTPMAPAPDEGNPPMVQIEYFEPMLLAAFPEEMSRKVLMAPIPKNPAIWGEVSRPSSPADPQGLVVKNAILLLEAFFHFEGLHHEIGRVRVLYTAGRACELSSAGGSTLQQLVGGTLDTLRESRMAFLRRTRGRFVWRAEDENVRELARLVDRYISLKPEEPREVNEEWYALPALNDLWFQWQKILSNKSLRFTMDGRATDCAQNTGSMRSKLDSLVSEALQASKQLEGTMLRLKDCGGLLSDRLTKSEKRRIQGVVDRTALWIKRFNQ